ncbi:MAG: methyltransferase domain-containing protein [Reichenbachiella sp.]
MLNFLKKRSSQLEIMDDFLCNGKVVDQTLRELHAINTYLGGNQISITAFQKLIKDKKHENYSLVDLGCGGGDTLILFSNWAKKNNVHLKLVGVDANKYITDYASQNCSSVSNISIISENIFSEKFNSEHFDVAHASLFLHHFTDAEIISLLRQLMDQVKIGIIINDLHRHPISYYFTKWILTRWSKSEMVKFDSVVSVARSFTRKELESYLQTAGINNYSLKWKWAFRWELIIRK